MNIVDTIKKETSNFLTKDALVEGEDRISYGDLLAAVETIASELKASGIQPAQRVAFLCEDSIDYVIVSLAILSISAVIVPISPSISWDEIDAVLKKIDVNFFLFDRAVYSREGARPAFFGGLCRKDFLLYARKAREELPGDYYQMNPAFIRFSSGTTGASKGVLISHDSIIERTDAADKVFKMTPDDIVIWILSMSFHFVVTILLFLRRATTIVLCGNAFPESLLAGLRDHQGSFIYASPFHYHILSHSNMFSPELFSHIRLAVTTAMQMPLSGARDFFEKFAFELTEAYGIIEVGLPFINFSEDRSERGSVGTILPDYQIKLINADKEGVGEVYLKGKGMFDAYFSPWQGREEAIPDGWFHTGDLGKLDRDGFLFLVGREKNVINCAGMKIFPYEVESILNQHPAIKESLVYGVDHPQYGQLPNARLVLKKLKETDYSLDELRRFCYQNLASYKVPKEFHFASRLEKTASGKLKRI